MVGVVAIFAGCACFAVHGSIYFTCSSAASPWRLPSLQLLISLGYDGLFRRCCRHRAWPASGALPTGWRKLSLLIAGLVTALAIAGLAVLPTASGLLAMSVCLGLAQSLAVVTLASFLMENSGEEERTYLFSFSFSLQMMVGMLGF